MRWRRLRPRPRHSSPATRVRPASSSPPLRTDKAERTNKFQIGIPGFFHIKNTNAPGPETRSRCAFWEVSPGFNGLPVFFYRRLGRQFSETIEDLVGPEPLEAVQRLVQRGELLAGDAADLFHGFHVLLVQRIDDAADFLALRGQTDADRAAINARALMIEEAELDELLQVVGDVGAEVVAARAQLACGQLLVADVIEQQSLHRVDVGATAAVEFVL